MANPTCVALVPARSGSKRVPNKNIKELNGHPLMAYTIVSALESGIFQSVLVSTDSQQYADIANRYGAYVPFLAGLDGSCHTDTSPDIAWVRYTLERLRKEKPWLDTDCFSILRVTSPFRTADTIRRAWARWCEKGEQYDSMRAVEKCTQHPYKMWRYGPSSSHLESLMGWMPDYEEHGAPGHSRQYASLPEIWVQNASLEIAWTKTVFEKGSIAGDNVLPFFTEGHEGMDVNRPQDWDAVELILAKHETSLPQIPEKVLVPAGSVNPYDPHSTGRTWHLDIYDKSKQRDLWEKHYPREPLPEGLKQ